MQHKRARRAGGFAAAGTLAAMEPAPAVTGSKAGRRLDAESRAWLDGLRADDRTRDEWIGELHELLLRGSRFEARRRAASLAHVRADEVDEIAHEAAADALVSVLARLDDFRGASRFTTWAYKFALLETAVKLRRRAWQARELPQAPERWERVADPGFPEDSADQAELVEAVRDAIATDLTRRQREVLLAVVLDGVPIDVLAERLGTTRGALYKTVHDARRKLRAALAARGLEAPAGRSGPR
jgi:RNA polymerase sigma-70 factor (ECF subfamily)